MHETKQWRCLRNLCILTEIYLRKNIVGNGTSRRTKWSHNLVFKLHKWQVWGPDEELMSERADVTDLGCVLIWINGVNERINIRCSLLATSIMSICYIYFVLLVYGPFIDFTNHLFCFISVNICIYTRTWYICIFRICCEIPLYF